MTQPINCRFEDVTLDDVADVMGVVAVFVGADAKLDACARKVNTLSRKAVERFVQSDAFAGMKAGEAARLAYPAGMVADAVVVVKLDRKPAQEDARKAGRVWRAKRARCR